MPATDAEAALYGYAVPADDAPVHLAPSYIRQNARAAAPEAWQKVSLPSGVTPADGQDEEWPRVRMTALGLQIRGEIKCANAIAMDGTLFTVPVGYRPVSRGPSRRFMAPSMGQGANGAYTALPYQAEIRSNGNVTSRQPIAAGTTVNVNAIVPYLT